MNFQTKDYMCCLYNLEVDVTPIEGLSAIYAYTTCEHLLEIDMPNGSKLPMKGLTWCNVTIPIEDGVMCGYKVKKEYDFKSGAKPSEDAWWYGYQMLSCRAKEELYPDSWWDMIANKTEAIQKELYIKNYVNFLSGRERYQLSKAEQQKQSPVFTPEEMKEIRNIMQYYLKNSGKNVGETLYRKIEGIPLPKFKEDKE